MVIFKYKNSYNVYLNKVRKTPRFDVFAVIF